MRLPGLRRERPSERGHSSAIDKQAGSFRALAPARAGLLHDHLRAGNWYISDRIPVVQQLGPKLGAGSRPESCESLGESVLPCSAQRPWASKHLYRQHGTAISTEVDLRPPLISSLRRSNLARNCARDLNVIFWVQHNLCSAHACGDRDQIE